MKLKNINGRSLKGKSAMSNRVVALIPVRGGSKSIPRKNIHPFLGKPLVYWALKAASECQLIEQVYLSTDDAEIRTVVQEFCFPKVAVIDRSPETATDTASTESVMLEFASRYEFEHVVLIQATSPLTESIDLEGGINKYLSDGADSLVTVVRQKRFIWQENEGKVEPLNYNPLSRPRRQDWQGFYVENGAFYVTSKQQLMETGSRLSGKISLYEMPAFTYHELDEPEDWTILEQLKKGRRPLVNKLSSINLLICDVDGVLTDAGMYYSEFGDEAKRFNTRDGKGIELLRARGVKVMFLTSEDVDIVRRRATKLNIDYIYLGVKDKLAHMYRFFTDHPEHSFENTAYIGDDINDLECLVRAGISACPSDGHPTVMSQVDIICAAGGGRGCVREFCDLILAGEV